MTTDWPRVGRYIRSRRKTQGLTQAAMQKDGGPSPALLRQIENGTYDADMHSSIRRAIEQNLNWHFGSIEAIHAGLEPSVMTEDDPSPIDVELSDELRLIVAAEGGGEERQSVFELLAEWVALDGRKTQLEQIYAERYGLDSVEAARAALEELSSWVLSQTGVTIPFGGDPNGEAEATEAQKTAFRLAAKHGQKEPIDEPQ